MFDRIKDKFLNMILSREFVLILSVIFCCSALIYRIFTLQIVNGETYLENFQLKIRKERSIPATRGNIFDRNGKLLAYNELAYSVTIEDVYESGKNKNRDLNNTIYKVIQLIESSGDDVISDFGIYLDQYGNYQFSKTDAAQLRFLADIYGHVDVKDLEYKEKTVSPDDAVAYLCSSKKYGIGKYFENNDGKTEFIPMEGYSKSDLIKIITIRDALASNGYQKYIATTIATDVSEKTVAVIYENSQYLDGVSISEDTIRKYVNSIYFSQIIGYTGKIPSERLNEFKQNDSSYAINDQVGLSGIESTMEKHLRGTKGSETIYVDNTGKVIESTNYVESVAGNDIYLTIDAEYQSAAYNILEQKIAGILVSKIQNIKEYKPSENSGSSDIKVAIYDVYNALFENSVIDISHFSNSKAGETERLIQNKYDQSEREVLQNIRNELLVDKTTYDKLSLEYQVYMLHIVSMLQDLNIIMKDSIDTSDEIYKAWREDETISLEQYLKHLIAEGWIDITKLQLDNEYADLEEIFENLVSFIIERLEKDTVFKKRIYKYMIKKDIISGREVCQILLEQNIVDVDTDTEDRLYNGRITAYQFMIDRIMNLDITPAQLALEPCSGSLVITDVNDGSVLACVSYPSYDNNRLANTIDANYYSALMNDESKPMYNHATQEETAPGSTFKMISATAGLLEGTVNTSTQFRCLGPFEKISPPPKCWIYPGAHGNLNVSQAIQHSCNNYFYEVAYRLGLEGEHYDSNVALEKLRHYADLFGLTEKSGVELTETEPQFSTEDAVRSAIGQGSHNYTTVGLARYVTTVANSGTCYNLSLIDKITDHNNNLLIDHSAEVRNVITLENSHWNAIHSGMRGVVESKAYFDIGVQVAGKTGTAQQSSSHPNHALFVSYAPYNEPEIAMAVRIVNGYSSDYAAQVAKDFYTYYFELDDEENIITGKATPSTTYISNNTD